MAVGKRPAAAVLDAGHQATDHCKRRRRVRIDSAADFEFEDTPCLGEGTFGAVHKARYRPDAIKFLRSTSTSTDDPDPSGVNNDNEIMCEARFLEACGGNTYVAASHGLLRPLKLCLAMDYVGPNLQAFLSKRPPLPEANVKAFMWQLLTGAKEMHERKIVHRDIKPANILVGQEGKILKICDLGLAMSMETEKTPYEYAGTVPYMAPDMLLGKPNYDARVDTWPLGCVMAEMLTGKALFKRDDAMAQLWAIFRVLGMPDETTWPEFESLPIAASVSRLFLEQRSTLGNFFPQEILSQDGYQVLKGLLECNPDKRLTAASSAPHRPRPRAKKESCASADQDHPDPDRDGDTKEEESAADQDHPAGNTKTDEEDQAADQDHPTGDAKNEEEPAADQGHPTGDGDTTNEERTQNTTCHVDQSHLEMLSCMYV